MKSSAPAHKAAAIEAVLKLFPNWSENPKQRLNNLSDANWESDYADPEVGPAPKSCFIQKQNSGMIMAPLSGGCADENVTIH